MKNGILDAVNRERIVESKLSVVVTEDCVIVPAFGGQPHTVLSLACLSAIKIIKIYHPSLLVIAAGLLFLCASAASSKEGAGTGLPIGMLGAVFLIAYVATQRARVVFMTGSEATQSVSGSFPDVSALVVAVQTAKRNLAEESSEKLAKTRFLTRVLLRVNGLFSPRIRTSLL